MELTIAQINAGVTRAAGAMERIAPLLNAADAKLGDGDTGSMLARALDKMAATDLSDVTRPDEAFARLSRAVLSTTGSSLGTLFGGGLFALSRQVKGEDTADWTALGPALAEAVDTMFARGGAKPGDKTVLDGLVAVAAGLNGSNNAEDAGARARQAAHDALDRFRNRPCRMGRAKFYAERSVGLDDPGMLALALLIDAIAQAD